MTGTARKIIHVDMDAFYASVEQRDDPKLRGKPVAVGGEGGRSVVAAASYEARAFGVHSAMPSFKAREKCPQLIFVRPRSDAYREVSRQIREIFAEHTPLIEPLSLDEAYLDVSENLQGLPTATAVARAIRTAIRERTGLTASAGVSYNKFLAKMASDVNKPDGQFVILPKDGEAFVASLPVKKFHGIGPATAGKMESLGIMTGADLRAKPLEFLKQRFGKSGDHFYWISRGVDERVVRPDRVRKSIGAENTFRNDLSTFEDLLAELLPLADKVWAHCERTQSRGRTITLKLKWSDFTQITRSRSQNSAINSAAELKTVVQAILADEFPLPGAVRLIGVSVSSLDSEPENREAAAQLSLL
jgi:DNA polymerase-4